MPDPVRRPLPDGVSFEVTERTSGAPTAVSITVTRPNYGQIGFCILEVLRNLVMTTTPRSLELISRNAGIVREVRRLVEIAGDTVIIPLRLHRQTACGNRVFAISINARYVTFDEDIVGPPPAPDTPNLPDLALPPLTDSDHGATAMLCTLVQGLLLDLPLGGVAGAIVSAGQMVAELIRFRGAYKLYAYRRGYWHVTFWEAPQRNNPEAGAFMSGGARSDRMGVINAYNAGYTRAAGFMSDGRTRARDHFLDNVWRRFYETRGLYDSGTTRAIEQVNAPQYQHSRYVAVTTALRRRYSWYSADLQELLPGES